MNGRKRNMPLNSSRFLSEFQPPDKPGETNNGSFLKPNQAITSKNGQYLLAYQRDGNLVIYKKEGMEQIWSSQTSGTQAYRTIMQFDGNLVIYSGNPEQPLAIRQCGLQILEK
jgi:hypothetical protein